MDGGLKIFGQILGCRFGRPISCLPALLFLGLFAILARLAGAHCWNPAFFVRPQNSLNSLLCHLSFLTRSSLCSPSCALLISTITSAPCACAQISGISLIERKSDRRYSNKVSIVRSVPFELSPPYNFFQLFRHLYKTFFFFNLWMPRQRERLGCRLGRPGLAWRVWAKQR